MKKQESLNNTFREIGKGFEQKYRSGFNVRKPKKIIVHTKQTLRTYRRETSLNMFEKLCGIILIWRYVKMTNIPIREILKLERLVLRGFHFMLGELDSEYKDELTYLLDETGPSRSAMHPGNPLRHLLNLKLLELQIMNITISIEDRDKLEIEWKKLYQELNHKFRFRVLVSF